MKTELTTDRVYRVMRSRDPIARVIDEMDYDPSHPMATLQALLACFASATYPQDDEALDGHLEALTEAVKKWREAVDFRPDPL